MASLLIRCSRIGVKWSEADDCVMN